MKLRDVGTVQKHALNEATNNTKQIRRISPNDNLVDIIADMNLNGKTALYFAGPLDDGILLMSKNPFNPTKI